jgi:DNA-binding CsgD family transcriptional regulator
MREELTDREKQVAAHLVAGRRIAGVAEELCLAENTVRNHLKRTFGKLELHSQSELIEFLKQHPSVLAPYQGLAGLLTPSDGDLLDELAEVDRATEKRLAACERGRSSLDTMKRIIRSVLPLDEERRHEWRVRLAAHVVGPQQRVVRNASAELHKKWAVRPLQRIEDFQARGWVRQDLDSEAVRRRLVSAVQAAALALLADETADEQARQLDAIDRVLEEIASDDSSGD